MSENKTDRLVACLRGRGDKLCSEAADAIERLQAERLMLDRRIHNQRVALRDNWQTIEMRDQYKRAWYPSKLLTAILNNRRSCTQRPE